MDMDERQLNVIERFFFNGGLVLFQMNGANLPIEDLDFGYVTCAMWNLTLEITTFDRYQG